MIIGLVGAIGSGKGTVARQLVDEFNFIQDSFASSVKDVCSIMFDWPRHLLEGDTPESRQWRETVDPWWSEKLNIPNFSPRVALTSIGTDAIRNNFNKDIWFLTLHNRVRKNSNKNIIISDARFPNEIKFIQDQSGILLKINRGTPPIWYETAIMANNGNIVAQGIMNTDYSYVHYSEWAWAGVEVFAELDNNSSIENLENQVRKIMTKISY